MAGGKETPRQKMIGMMYLVLTALLALNVSKEILQAFVTMDKNTQTSNRSQYQRGAAARSELQGIASDNSEPERQKIAAEWMIVVDKIDNATAKRIKMIDELKVEILEHCGEDVNAIIVDKGDPKNPTKPKVFDLDKVAAMDKYDAPMHLMIGDDIKNIKGKGVDLWNSLKTYNTELTETLANWTEGVGSDTKTYKFKAPVIGDLTGGEESKEIKAIVEKAIKAGSVQPDDKSAIMEIYGILAKDELVDLKETKGVHWMGRAFDHTPVVAALALLSSMQNEVLNARAIAVTQIRSRVGGGQYSFNQIMPLAYGPEFVNQGDSVTIEVLMAAFDSYKTPRVSVALNDTLAKGEYLPKESYGEGKGYVSFKAGATGIMTYSGMVGIQNKSGVWKDRKWKKVIQVIKPSGTVSLPEMNVLYRGYDNIVQGGATGFPSFSLSGGGNVSLSQSGDHYVAKPGSGRTANISVIGKSANGKTTSLGNFEFRVKNMPKADLYLGALGPDVDAPAGTMKAQSRLFAKYGDEIALKATFKVVSWKLTISGAPQPVSGTGNVLSAQAMSYLRQVRSGTMVNITAFYTEPSGRRIKKVGAWTVK
jgi:gliding motility-associated protein GldM